MTDKDSPVIRDAGQNEPIWTERTPLPLSVDEDSPVIRDADGATVAVASYRHQAQAIVRCVNAHDELEARIATITADLEAICRFLTGRAEDPGLQVGVRSHGCGHSPPRLIPKRTPKSRADWHLSNLVEEGGKSKRPDGKYVRRDEKTSESTTATVRSSPMPPQPTKDHKKK